MKALLFDYGAGNLHSLSRALQALGVEVTVEADPLVCARSSELLVLPGVGAFGLAAERLAPGRDALRAQLLAGRPCLGICLGMQLFFARSEEGPGLGLDVLAGEVRKLTTRRCPHIGWTAVEGHGEMYFAHSFACHPTAPQVVRARAIHEGEAVAAIIRSGRLVGTQFHPEKSSKPGLELLGSLLAEVTA
jgi:glutamine amidotransferase